MRQHPDSDPYPSENEDDEQDLEELGTPVYQGTGLSICALTAEELQRFLDAHAGQPAELLGGGWAAMNPPEELPGVPRTPPAATLPVAPAEPPAGSLGSPGRSALAAYRQRRAEELADWTRTLAWRAPLVVAAGAVGQVLAGQVGLSWAGLVGLALAALVAWRLRFRPSEQARTWQRGARGERRTAHLLDRLTGEGFVVFHDLAVPGSRANVDHSAIGPTGLFVIDSKQWTGSVHQSADGPVWHNHYPLYRTLETVRWEAQQVSRVLGSRAAALLCVHGAHVQGGGLQAQGVAIVPAYLLRSALGQDRVLSDADVGVLATTARLRLRPATSRTNPERPRLRVTPGPITTAAPRPDSLGAGTSSTRSRACAAARSKRPRRDPGTRPRAGLLPRPAPGPTPRPARRQCAGGGADLTAAPLRPPARRHPAVRACDRPSRPGAARAGHRRARARSGRATATWSS